jgi:hypothetical protein
MDTEILEYLRDTSHELAALADTRSLDSLAYVFRMAALDAGQLIGDPSSWQASNTSDPLKPTATILPFRAANRRT